MIIRLLLASVVVAGPVLAQDGDMHVLVVTGLSGEPYFAASFANTAEAIVETAGTTWGIPSDRITWLAERQEGMATGRATKASLDSAFASLLSTSRPGDVVFVFLVGHGSGRGEQSKLSLPGPDPTVVDYASWFDRFDDRTLVVIIGASASGDFLPILAHPGRVIVTATRSSTERNESLFASRFSHGLASLEADGDKDGLVSVLEAFGYAQREVAVAYEADGRLMTEHAQLDDNGDGKGTDEPGQAGVSDGALARRLTFGVRPGSTDPRVTALFAQRRTLEDQVEALRRRKDSMPSPAYTTELDRLLLAIATKSSEIRASSVEGTP